MLTKHGSFPVHVERQLSEVRMVSVLFADESPARDTAVLREYSSNGWTDEYRVTRAPDLTSGANYPAAPFTLGGNIILYFQRGN